MSLFYKMNDINTTQMRYMKGMSNYFKNPTENDWRKYIEQEQTLEQVLSKDWNNSTGVGAVLGWNGLRALDVDGVHISPHYLYGDDVLPEIYPGQDFLGLLYDFLSILGLPKDYEWVVLSGSGQGFHVLFKCDDIGEPLDAVSFAPSDNCLDESLQPQFDHIELRWREHLVLPPSLHKSGNRYNFLYKKPPVNPILSVAFTKIDLLILKYCGIRTLNSYTLQDGTELELTNMQKCISRTGSHFTVPDDYSADTLGWIEASNAPEAMNSLAIKYLFGDGVACDVGKAISLFQNSNSKSSLYNLDKLYKSNYFKQIGRRWSLTKVKLGIAEKEIDVASNLETKEKMIIEFFNRLPKFQIKNPYYLFFDTETTGVPKDYNAPASNTENWPRLVQLGWILTDKDGEEISSGNYIVKPDGFVIPSEAAYVHGITTEKALSEGESLKTVIDCFLADAKRAKCYVGHNISFDQHVVGAELCRLSMVDSVSNGESICTMKTSTDYCKIPGYYGYKWPKLQELHKILFGFDFEEAHDAMADISATKKCFFEMKKRHIV